MHVSPSVRAVQVPETNPMHPQFTTIYLVGDDQVLTIDSGADEDRYRWMLRGYLAAEERAEIALCAVTHYHFDHSSNIRWLCEEFGAQAYLAPETVERLEPQMLPPQAAQPILPDGSLDAGSVRLQTLHTPGHSPESFCFYLEEEGVLFTGDTILGGTTTAVQDLGAYMHSLARIRDLPNLQILCPGHGPLINHPVQVIDEYIAHRNERERQVLEVLADGEALTSWEIMERLYKDVDPRLRRAADGNVRSHLAKLEDEGRLRVESGKPRVLSADEQAQAAEEDAERAEVLRKADEYRTQARRRALFLQENPPAHHWVEPPRYQLL
jgi:glyoxylase-like metal-dependent hydrolase (beta-lactamase superfamily II)